jgi:hypothetical protein
MTRSKRSRGARSSHPDQDCHAERPARRRPGTFSRRTWSKANESIRNFDCDAFSPNIEPTKWRPDLFIIAPGPVCCENAWDRYATSEQHHRPGKRRFVGKSRVAATRVQGEGIKRAMIAPKVRSFLEHSSRRDNFRVLSVPRDHAAQPVSVLVQDLEGLHRALMPMLDPPEYSPDLFVDRARAQVCDRDHFASHRVCEIRRVGGGVRRTQGDCVGLFH